jgi:hypothetical protein
MTKERATTFALAAVLAGFAGLSFWRGHETRAQTMLGCALILAVAALVSVKFASWFYRSWLRIAYLAGAAHTTAILALLYFLGFTGYRLWGRFTGRDALGRRAPRQDSYWTERTRTQPSRWQFERLY